MYDIPKDQFEVSFDQVIQDKVLRISATRKEITQAQQQVIDLQDGIIYDKIKLQKMPNITTYQGILTVAVNDTKKCIKLIGQLDERFIIYITDQYNLQKIFYFIRDILKQSHSNYANLFKDMLIITTPENKTLKIHFKQYHLDVYEKFEFRTIKFDEYTNSMLSGFKQEISESEKSENLLSQINRSQQQVQIQEQKLQKLGNNIYLHQQLLEKQQEQVAAIDSIKIQEISLQSNQIKEIADKIQNCTQMLQESSIKIKNQEQTIQDCFINAKELEKNIQQNQKLIQFYQEKLKPLINEIQLMDLQLIPSNEGFFYLTPVLSKGLYELKFEFEEDFEYQIGILEGGNTLNQGLRVSAFFLLLPSGQLKRGDDKSFDLFSRQLLRRDRIGLRVDLSQKQFTVTLNDQPLPPFNLMETFSSFAFALKSNQKLELSKENKYELYFQ